MEEKKLCFKELVCGWEALNIALKNYNKIDLEIFGKTFTQTYLFFKEYSDKDKIKREHIDLIISAALFANADNKDIDFYCRAALVLTDRMLNAVINNACESDKAVVYILEARKEIYLDFNDVNASVKKLAKFFELDYYDI